MVRSISRLSSCLSLKLDLQMRAVRFWQNLGVGPHNDGVVPASAAPGYR
jgi:hypothetical protein